MASLRLPARPLIDYLRWHRRGTRTRPRRRAAESAERDRSTAESFSSASLLTPALWARRRFRGAILAVPFQRCLIFYLPVNGSKLVRFPYLKFRKKFRWLMLRSEATAYVKSCKLCQVNQVKFRPRPDRLSLRSSDEPSMNTVHVDFAELSKRSARGTPTRAFLVTIKGISGLQQHVSRD